MKRRRGYVGNVEYAGGLKLIGLPQLIQSGIARSIVDDDHFETGIFESEQSSDTADD